MENRNEEDKRMSASPPDLSSEMGGRREAVDAIRALAKEARGMSAKEIIQARDEGRR